MNVNGGKFHDIHEFEQVSLEFAFETNLLQLGKGVPTILIHHIHLGDVILRRLQFSHALVDGFRIPNGWTNFIFTPTVADSAVWNGVASQASAVAIMRDGMDHETLTRAGWCSIEIDVADELIHREELISERLFGDVTLPEKGQLPLPVPAATAITRELGEILPRHGPATVSGSRGVAAATLRRYLLDLLAGVMDQVCTAPTEGITMPGHGKYQLVRQARDLLEAQVRGNPRIESIAAELGVSPRTLQRSFTNVIGMSPKQYFLARKLDAARRSLISHRRSVADVAQAYGFASASRFSEQFHRQYGCKPSTVSRIMTG